MCVLDMESPIAVAAPRLSFRCIDSWGSRPRLYATTAPRLGPMFAPITFGKREMWKEKRCVDSNAQRESVYARLQF